MASKKPATDVWKNSRDEYPEYFDCEYIWKKNIDKYTDTEIKKFGKHTDKIDLIYNNGVAFLQQMYDAIKSYQNRLAALLGSLFILVTGLFSYAFSNGSLNETFEWLAFILASGYLGIMIRLYHIYTNQIAISAHFQPSDYMKKDNFYRDINLMKVDICATLQVSARRNRSTLQKLSEDFKFHIKLIIWFSLTAMTFAVLASFFEIELSVMLKLIG